MSIFEYSDYRQFLRLYIDHLPKRGRGEINRMAQFIGVHPSLLSQVLADQKNLSLEQAQLLCEYLGFIPTEMEYFLCSVQFQKAGTAKLRAYFKEKLHDLRKSSIELSERVRQDRQLSEEEKAIFYSHWLYAALWLQSSCGGGQSLDEIVERFDIPRERVTEILHFLVETRLCLAENGKFLMGPQSVHLARGSAYLTRHHTNWRLRAIEASDQIGADELMYTAPISISKSDLKKLRSRLADLVKEITDVAIASEAEELVCFNLDFFLIQKKNARRSS